jgi:hypothetical protein
MSPSVTYISPGLDLRRNIYSSTSGTSQSSSALIGLSQSDCKQRIFISTESNYVSSPERRYVEDPYYTQFPPRSGSITPVIIDEESRFRMEHMERQLANLTGLVQKALVYPTPPQLPTPTNRLNHLPRTVLPTGAITSSTQNSYRDYIPTRESYRGTQTLNNLMWNNRGDDDMI